VPVHEGFEDFVDHPDVIVAFVLGLHVDEVFVEGVEAAGKKPGHVEGDLGGGAQEFLGILQPGEGAGGEGADGGGADSAEERGHFAEDGSGFADAGDTDVVAEDLNITLDQDEEGCVGLALFQYDGAGVDGVPGRVCNQIQNGSHGAQA
jgi:hypothetical protein